MTGLLNSVYSSLWGAPTMLFILGVGLYLTLRTAFVQVRLLPDSFRILSPSSTGNTSRISPFRALCTALAATVGTGNLVGVAGAICLGGPGAILWMLVCAFFGMAVKYAETVLAVRYRVSINNEIVGGPMYMICQGLKRHWHPLAYCYSILGLIASFGVGNLVQSNTIASCVGSLGMSPMSIGLVIAFFLAAAFRRGAFSVGQTAEQLVPYAVGVYVLLCIFILVRNAQRIPIAISQIWNGAFSPGAVTGGMIGSAMKAVRIGCSRGIISNEAGIGTASIAHASADVDHPVQQGIVAVLEVFLDTFLICSMTALVILCSEMPIPYGKDQGFLLVTQSFSDAYQALGSIFVAVFIIFFAYATILGWSLYGLRCCQFLFGHGSSAVFFVLQIVTVFLGVNLQAPSVWRFSEIINGLMTIPTLLSLIMLSPELIRLTKEYSSGTTGATGGYYANIHQCQPLRTVTYAEIPSAGCCSKEKWQKHLSSEYRPARSGNSHRILRHHS